jgi:hypothetical protein
VDKPGQLSFPSLDPHAVRNNVTSITINKAGQENDLLFVYKKRPPSGNRIVTAFIERMTTADALDG